MRKWLPLVTVLSGSFMLLVDVTVVNVALPAMASDLSASFSSLQWVVDVYALVLAALVLGAGSISDLIGHRRAYIGGLALFAASSLACGLAPNAEVLIAARIVQGIGAAGMFATVFALLNSNYSGRERGTAYGLWGAVAGTSAAIGPIVGGVLTEVVSWRWVFFVNLPVSAIAIALSFVVLRDVHAPAKGRVDVLGVLTFTAAASALTYGLIRSNEHGWSQPHSWIWFVAGPALLALFIVVELKVPQPMLDLGLMRNRSFVGVLLAAFFMSFSAFAAVTYTSIWLQSVRDMSPIQVGFTGLPLAVASFAASAVIGRFLHTARPGPLIAGGLVLVGVGGIVGGLLMHGPAGWLSLVPGNVLVGAGAGLATPTLSSAAMGSVPVERGGMAAGAVNTARQLGFALGIAVLGSVFSARAAHILSEHNVPGSAEASRALGGGQAPALLRAVPTDRRAALDSALEAASVGGVSWTLWVSGLTGVLCGLAVFYLVRPDRADEHEPAPGADPTGQPVARRPRLR
ncbi:MFS transporter [Lentzea jiangxiensis]|uniref:Drug resistance transporter, EmrB/QacA subfamily n=1 Tax=Lentzea jiangxiensis TaxID=641025 RepID=A0A1H0WZE7_9PSEU|nr:MFS transporter [Lentzea jiangxiensis]SDP95606.1 drug resistance transporter, EmrB/QacA subfamily [Lentzea jiangxiensis]